MQVAGMGAIDCDVHPNVPGIRSLLPYLDEHWRESVEVRGMDGFESRSYPIGSPLSARPDWRDETGRAGQSVTQLAAQVFDRWDSALAVCNCLYGVQLIHDEHMAAAFARAVNAWLAQEWLDPEPRLRASIVLPVQNPDLAVDEIERCAADPRFVQVLMLAMGEMPLGRSFYWPIYAAAERHGLPVGIHAGSSYHHPVTPVGWPTYYVEDYVSQAQGFQSQLSSLVAEGVFAKFPGLRVVLIESGITWLPGFLWRFSKFWRGLRNEVPWVDRSPVEIVREHVRLTLTPVDAPPGGGELERVLEHLGSDRLLLYSSDFPHWQFEGDNVLPEGLPPSLIRKILVDNPRETYRRIGGPS